MTQLRELVRPFPDTYVEKKGQHDYIAHAIVQQRLMEVVGIPQTSILREIRDAEGKLTGVVMRMTVTVDGRQVSVEEVGEADNPQSKTDGARAKDAASDGYKRCAMRLGAGLHLWSHGHYFIDERLDAVQPERQADGSRPPRKPPVNPAKDPQPRPADDSPPFDAKGSITDQQMADISGYLVGEDAPDMLTKILEWAKVDKLEELSSSQAEKTVDRLTKLDAERRLAEAAGEAA